MISYVYSVGVHVLSIHIQLAILLYVLNYTSPINFQLEEDEKLLFGDVINWEYGTEK